jgi:hypothetical protein
MSLYGIDPSDPFLQELLAAFGAPEPTPWPQGLPEQYVEPERGWMQNLGMLFANQPPVYRPRGGRAHRVEDFLGQFAASAANAMGTGAARNELARLETNQRIREAQAQQNRERLAAIASAQKPTVKQELTPDEKIRLAGEEAKARKAGEFAAFKEAGIPYRQDPTAFSAPGEVDPEAIVDAVEAGLMPPSQALVSNYRSSAAIKTAFAKRGTDLMKLTIDEMAVKRHYASLNGTIQLRLRQAAENARASTFVLEELNNSLVAKAPRTRSSWVNRPLVDLIEQGAWGSDASYIATQLRGQVVALQSELSNVYQGGGVPTDEAKQMATRVLNENMSPRNLAAAIRLARRDIGVRLNAIATVGVVSPSNPVTAEPQTIIQIGPRAIPLIPPRVPEQPLGDMVLMEAPNGQRKYVEANKVQYYVARGAKVVR